MVSLNNFYNKNKKCITISAKIVYIVAFIVAILFVGSKHEHWADEAQAWLIARDLSLLDIIKFIRYEGTPPLWHIILKIFIVCGGKYNQLIFLTTFFSVLGIVYLFKNESIPVLIKILLPFTYFIFFQYTIVARSYVLIFPVLMYILYIYPNKEKHLIKYAISLILLMNISSHTFLIAAGLWLEFFLQERKEFKKNNQKDWKKITFFIVMAIALLIVVIVSFPPLDGGYIPGSSLSFYRIISESMFTSADNPILVGIGVILFFIVIGGSFMDYNNMTKGLLLLFPNLVWICCVNGSGWHAGILFLLVIFITTLTNSFKKVKFLYFIMILSMIIQIYWSCRSSINDVKYRYAVGEDVKNYLEEIGYKDNKIIGVDFWAIQVNPFFDKNIYCNFNNSFVNWKKVFFKEYSSKKILDSEIEYDIYVIPCYQFKYNKDFEYYKNSNAYYEVALMEKIYNSGKYHYKYFEGNIYYKDKIYESTSLYVFVKDKSEE